MANNSSKLEPFRDFIASERRRGTTYRRIAELLAAKGITADYSTIHSFVRVRSKPARKVITMLDSASEPAPPLQADVQKPSTSERETPARAGGSAGQLDAIRLLKQGQGGTQARPKGLPSFKEGASLERLSDEEARRLRDEL